MSSYGQPYWWDGQPKPPRLSALPDRCDLLIIGAGYTGLSAAITAASNGVDVCVVDAQHPGFGASSRNGGMCGAHPRLSLAATSKQFGEKTARGLFNEAGIAFEYFEGLIKIFKINCQYQKTGRIQLAWTRADFEAQKKMAADMNRDTEFKVDVVERDELPAHLKTDHYFGGLFYEQHGGLQPRRFVDGLLRTALQTGASVVPDMPIRRIQKTVSGYIAETDGPTIRAEKVLVATNGYSKGAGAMRWLSRRVFPLPSYIIATEPLPKSLIDHIAPGRRMMVETRARHSYWRVSPDGKRIIWGGRAAIRQADLEYAAARLKATMTEIWPDLWDVTLSHAWKGNTGYTFSNAPHVGQVGGVHYAAGYCGGGVVIAPYLGMKAAFQAMGDKRGRTAYSNTELTTRPYHLGGFPWFLEPADRWYNWVVDGRQIRQAQKDRGI
ncbi:MAG: FAD-binding oxidoreductase [Pseudomonadota bacterium]